jgi:prepilin-type N-terminal cleavage/methylation domain-containing protein
MLKDKFQKGFTTLELMIVMLISSMLIGVITLNLINLQNRTNRTSNIDTLVSDLKNQQVKAMTAATEGRATSDSYGIYFLSDRYVLFHGNSFNPNESSNFEVILPEDLEIQSTTLPNNAIVFNKLSGEVLGFSGTTSTVVIRSLNLNEQKTININRYGVITGIN